MPDIEALDGVAAGSIEAVNGVAKANIQAINGCGIPASGASLWTIVGADGAVATAAASDLNSWTGYVSSDMGSTDYNAVAYGKDGSGNPLWVAVNSNGVREIRYGSDPTNTSGWSDVNPSNPGKLFTVLWGNNVWMAAGQNGEMWRSTDGSSWSEVDMSGVTGWYTTGVDVRHLASDGAGTWMCDNHDFIFKSTDNGSTWAKVYDTADSPVSDDSYLVRGIAYSTYSGTSRWVVLVRKSGNTRIIHATAADTSSWTLATVGGSAASGQNLIAHTNRHIAAAGGTVIMAVGDNFSRSTDGGQDWTSYTGDSDDLPRTDARGLATDGNGTWVVVHDSGRVSVNTNDGTAGNWAEQTGVQDGGSNTNLRFPTGGANVENLDAVAANVYLPL
tara:strand:+ start:484 stop:1647 length:1164 start_codon:yes stop_codon:yes gene_type:complete